MIKTFYNSFIKFNNVLFCLETEQAKTIGIVTSDFITAHFIGSIHVGILEDLLFHCRNQDFWNSGIAYISTPGQALTTLGYSALIGVKPAPV